jgi:hypothetical protein
VESPDGITSRRFTFVTKKYPSLSELAFSTSSVRYAPTTASTLFDLLHGPAPQKIKTKTRKGRRPTYGAKVILSLTAIWEAAGYPCSARLKALLPLWLPWAIKRLTLSDPVQKQLLTISPATIDRRLKSKKRQLKTRLYGRTKPGTLLKHHIPIKTDSWDVKTPGFTETDLVSHSGNSASGEFLHSLNVTDIHCTWVETRALMGKSQIGVLNAMKDIEQALPFKLLGIDSDNGSEFINYHRKTFCDQNKIQFTRGRPYRRIIPLCARSLATCAMTPRGLKKPSMTFTKTN